MICVDLLARLMMLDFDGEVLKRFAWLNKECWEEDEAAGLYKKGKN